jgi:uncharacterized protein YidB (DUF937 family)
MKALLGVLAVAGFQNRDKIGELLRGIQTRSAGADGRQAGTTDDQPSGGLGDLLGKLTGGGSGGLGGLGDLLGGASGGGILSGGIGGLLEQFQNNGHGDKAQSWVQHGPNAAIEDVELSQALGPEVLDDLSARTGLSPAEIVSRLRRDLPTAVDELTPDGKIPTDDDPTPGSSASVPPVKPQIV